MEGTGEATGFFFGHAAAADFGATAVDGAFFDTGSGLNFSIEDNGHLGFFLEDLFGEIAEEIAALGIEIEVDAPAAAIEESASFGDMFATKIGFPFHEELTFGGLVASGHLVVDDFVAWRWSGGAGLDLGDEGTAIFVNEVKLQFGDLFELIAGVFDFSDIDSRNLDHDAVNTLRGDHGFADAHAIDAFADGFHGLIDHIAGDLFGLAFGVWWRAEFD